MLYSIMLSNTEGKDKVLGGLALSAFTQDSHDISLPMGGPSLVLLYLLFPLLSILLLKLTNLVLSHKFSRFYSSFLLSPSHCVMNDGEK